MQYKLRGCRHCIHDENDKKDFKENCLPCTKYSYGGEGCLFAVMPIPMTEWDEDEH